MIDISIFHRDFRPTAAYHDKGISELNSAFGYINRQEYFIHGHYHLSFEFDPADGECLPQHELRMDAGFQDACTLIILPFQEQVSLVFYLHRHDLIIF